VIGSPVARLFERVESVEFVGHLDECGSEVASLCGSASARTPSMTLTTTPTTPTEFIDEDDEF
jgi:hypothetical protein